jgi:hypothetical protein
MVNGKGLYHEGHDVIKGWKMQRVLQASFVVTSVSFVVENGIPARNERALLLMPYRAAGLSQSREA